MFYFAGKINSYLASRTRAAASNDLPKPVKVSNAQQLHHRAPLRNCFGALFASCLLLLPGTLAAQSPSGGVTSPTAPDQGMALQQTIHDYIIAHPEVIIESLQRAKANAEQHKAELIKSRIVAFRKNLIEDPNAPVLGNAKGDVTLVEFFDYRCPYCQTRDANFSDGNR